MDAKQRQRTERHKGAAKSAVYPGPTVVAPPGMTVNITATIFAEAPSITNSLSFLARTWKSSGELTPDQKRGLCQLTLLSIVAHIEDALRSLVIVRLRDAMALVPIEQASTTQAVRAMKSLLESLIGRVSTESTFSKLKEYHDQLGSDTLQLVLGDQSYEDLQALGDMRNLLAHGRRFEGLWKGQNGLFAFTSTQAVRIVKQLKSGGINISDNPSDQDFYTTWLPTLFSADSMKFWYDAATKIEGAILSKFTPTGDVPPNNLRLPSIEFV